MTLRSKEYSIGAWAFLIGVILAIIIGLSSSFLSAGAIKSYNAQIYGILVLIGLFVGISIKVGGKESDTFLIAGTVIIIVSKFGIEAVTESLIGVFIGKTVSTIFAALLTLFAPATIVVALKRVFSVARV